MAINWQNKSVFTGDNLPIMRGMNSESVDLIYLDPPFNSKANYAAPIGSKAAGAEFKDTWTLSDIDIAWLDLIEIRHPALNRVIQAAMTKSDKSYLVYMAVRLLEMKRILKDSGSIYLHCDPTMSHYLKLIMDAVFGRKAFRNEITWKRNSSHNDTKAFGRVADTILFYGSAIRADAVRVPLDPNYVAKFYRHKDDRGQYRHDNIIRSASLGSRPNLSYEYRDFKPDFGWRMTRPKIEALDADGRIAWSATGRPYLKRYLHENKGQVPTSIWTDIPPVQGAAKERTGYPTQKPLALLDRIIRASSNYSDIIFDPFCGCATTLVAADRLERQWIGIDISSKAVELVIDRIKQDQGLFREIIARNDIPQRTDIEVLRLYNSLDNKKHLYGQQAGNCNGCYEHFETRHLEVDHIIARSMGGTDHIENLQLLCGNCNRVKGNRGQEYLIAKLEGRKVAYA